MNHPTRCTPCVRREAYTWCATCGVHKNLRHRKNIERKFDFVLKISYNLMQSEIERKNACDF